MRMILGTGPLTLRRGVAGVLIGPPGSGKGTQAALLAPALGIPHVSTGDCLRAEVTAGTELGRRVEPILTAGGLVSDDLIERVLAQRLTASDAAPGVLLDGYPRTLPQARTLDGLLAAAGLRIGFVVVLRVDERTLTDRLVRRAEVEHRADDAPATIAERLRAYWEQTEPVIGHLGACGVPVFEVDADGTVEAVRRRIALVVSEARQPEPCPPPACR